MIDSWLEKIEVIWAVKTSNKNFSQFVIGENYYSGKSTTILRARIKFSTNRSSWFCNESLTHTQKDNSYINLFDITAG